MDIHFFEKVVSEKIAFTFLAFLAGVFPLDRLSFLLAGDVFWNSFTNVARFGDPGGKGLALLFFLNFLASSGLTEAR